MDESAKGCCPKTFCHKEKRQNANDDPEQDLDNFIAFMQRHQPSSNPSLRVDPSTVALPPPRSESHGPIKAHTSRTASFTRDDRLSNLHVIEDIYYNIVGKLEARPEWKTYDASAFRAVKLAMGRGACSQVHLLQHISSGYMGVMKVIPANKIFNARAELNVLTECSESPFILQVIDAFSLEKVSYIFLEYAPFRTLDDLTQLTDGVGSEKSTLFALEILLGIEFLHSQKILHRDIKPENVFLLISGHVKLGDFSSSKFIDTHTNKMKGLCCTYVTRPPEVWAYDYYSYPVDVWAFGISMYNIISNTWPIVHASQERQVAHVNRGDILFSDVFSASAADLIMRAVQPKPEDRWTVTQLISHSYFLTLKDPFPAPFTPSELLEMYSAHHTLGEELSFIQDMVAHLP